CPAGGHAAGPTCRGASSAPRTSGTAAVCPTTWSMLAAGTTGTPASAATRTTTTSALVNCCPAATGCATARTGCLSSARSATVTNTSTTTATPSRASTNRPGERRGRSPTASAEDGGAATRPLYRGGSSICTGELIVILPSPDGHGL